MSSFQRAPVGVLLGLAIAGSAVLGAGAVLSPLMVVGAVLGLLFVVVALRDLAAGLALFAILIFVERIPTVGAHGVTFVKLAGIVLLISWLLRLAEQRPSLPLFVDSHPVLSVFALSFLLWAFASALWADDSSATLSGSFRLLQGILLFFIASSAITQRRHLWWLLSAFVFGAVISASFGLLGTTSIDRPDIYVSGRLTGGIDDPNELAATLVPAAAFAAFMLVVSRTALTRWLLLLSAGLCVFAILRTESRGGIIGFGCVLLATLVLSGNLRLRAVISTFGISAAALVYFVLVAPPEALRRITDFRGGGSGRTDLWAVALDVARHHPLAGAGVDNFSVIEPRYALFNVNLSRPDLIVDVRQPVHNMYLQVLAELGVIGFVLFCGFMAGAMLVALRAVWGYSRTGDARVETLGRGLLIGTIGMLGAFTFLTAQYEKQLFLVLGALAALSSLDRGRVVTPVEERISYRRAEEARLLTRPASARPA